MNYYQILELKPTIDLDEITKAYQLLSSNGPNPLVEEAFVYLSKGGNRFLYYATIRLILVNLEQLERWIDEDDFEKIVVIVESLKLRDGTNWWQSDQGYVECAVRDAIIQEKIEIVRYFLSAGVSARSRVLNLIEHDKIRSGLRYSFACYAVLTGQLELVQLLVEHGAIFDSSGRYCDDSCLQMAVSCGYEDIVEYLLAQGALANGYCTNHEGRKPFLLVAVEMRRLSMMSKLLANGGDIEVALNSAHTYFRKKRQGYLSALQVLNEKLAKTTINIEEKEALEREKITNTSSTDLLVKEYQESIAIFFAHAIGVDFSGQKDNKYMYDFHSLAFLQGIDVSGVNFVGISIEGVPVTKEGLMGIGAINVDQAFFSIFDYDSIEQVPIKNQLHQKAEKLGADFALDGTVNLVPLWRAADIGDLETVKCRLAAGVNPNEVDNHSILPLMAAARSGFYDVVSILLCNPRLDKDVIIDVIFAISSIGQREIIKLLYAAIDLNSSTRLGDTPLHLAAHFGDEEHIQLLIDRGAVINAQNIFGETALISAISKTSFSAANFAVIKTLLANGADVGESSITCAIDNENRPALELLLPLIKQRYNSDPHDSTKPWYVPFMFYAFNKPGVIEIWGLLKEHGADFNLKDHEGNSLLHYAVMARHLVLVKYLLENDADLHVLDDEGETVLHIAARNADQQLCEFLLGKGIDLERLNKDGQTALACLSEAHQAYKARLRENPRKKTPQESKIEKEEHLKYINTRYAITHKKSVVDELVRQRTKLFTALPDDNAQQTSVDEPLVMPLSLERVEVENLDVASQPVASGKGGCCLIM